MRIAILSDIHAFAAEPDAVPTPESESDPSWVRTIPDKQDERRAPFQALQSLIAKDGLTADYVFCLGDMGDKADAAGIGYAWSWVDVLAKRLSAQRVLATTGNHDVDAYGITRPRLPTDVLRALQPPFPIDDAPLRDKYWDDHVTRLDEAGASFLILNSCAEHESREQAERGRLKPETLDLARDLMSSAPGPLKLLLLHHHPYAHDAIARSDYSAMEAGTELLAACEGAGDWLVVHGHRHYPTITYSGKTQQGPVILGAGSFSASLYRELQGRVRNQFIIMDVGEPGLIQGTSGVTGRISAWEYHWQVGWSEPSSSEGIPDQSGFGYRGSLAESLSRITQIVLAADGVPITWAEALLAVPEFAFMTPEFRQMVLSELDRDPRFVVRPRRHYAASPDEVTLWERP